MGRLPVIKMGRLSPPQWLQEQSHGFYNSRFVPVYKTLFFSVLEKVTSIYLAVSWAHCLKIVQVGSGCGTC
jgi:hypothetical protein